MGVQAPLRDQSLGSHELLRVQLGLLGSQAGLEGKASLRGQALLLATAWPSASILRQASRCFVNSPLNRNPGGRLPPSSRPGRCSGRQNVDALRDRRRVFPQRSRGRHGRAAQPVRRT